MSLIREYRSDMQKKELLLTYTEYREGSDYYEKMVRFNDIPGVLKYRKDINDGIPRFVYDAGGKRPISLEYEDKKPGYVELKNLLYDIMDSIEESRDYLIKEEDFVINDECIFVDDSGKAYIVCLPEYNKPLKSQLSTLFEFFMDRIDYKDKAAVVALYDIYRKSKEQDFSFDYIRGTFGKREKRENAPAQAQINDTAMQELFADSIPEVNEAPVQSVPAVVKERPPILKTPDKSQKRKKRSIFSFMEKGEETCLLYSATEPVVTLESEENGERISISKWPFTIGKGDQTHKPDYFLSYPQISRMHARLLKTPEGDIMLEDMKSLNGTFVNGKELPGGSPVKINIGDSISFANRGFVLQG